MSCTKTSPYGATGRRISLWKTQPGDIGEEPHPCMPTVFPFGVLGEAKVRVGEGPTRRARPGHGPCSTTVLYGGGGGRLPVRKTQPGDAAEETRRVLRCGPPPRGTKGQAGLNPRSGRCRHRGFVCKNFSTWGLEEADIALRDATRRHRGRTSSVGARCIPPRGPGEADDEGRGPALAD